ncbi:MAG: EAL domain-containing response regulator [Rugosibacter sp.]|nr:EAL domain-containing response regulator [Rugosibacter sp.]
MTETSNLRILALDDDAFMLKLLGHVLAGLGHTHVVCHENGLDALAACDTPDGMPDLILLDINMPSMDGVEFVRHLAERKYFGCLILVSGEDDLMLRATEKLARAHSLSVLGSLHKPPIPASLSALLEKCLARRASLAAAGLCAPGKTYDVDAVRVAITKGELVNYYQPKVAVATGRVVGVETLVRWRHPEDGLVFPDRFIPVAEMHGLINDLTRVVLREALVQTRRWQEAGLSLRVAVNVSMDDLAVLEFADFVVAEAAAVGVPSRSLVLEVTESRLMQRLTTALDVLTRLRLKRFNLSIDDFGTGHSSLAQLRDIPFDELKIDQSFTHRAWRDERLRAMFEASLELSRRLDMEAVAEGVEDIDDWNFLRTVSCPVAQGYFIARPMPAADLPGWMEDWRRRVKEEHLAAEAP